MRIKAHRTVRRRGPDLAFAIDVHGDRAAERRHVSRCLVDGDGVGGGVEFAQTAAAGIDVEPEVAIVVPHQAVSGGGVTRGVGRSDVFHRAGFGVHLADGHAAVRVVGGEVDVAIEAQSAIVRYLADFGSCAERPVSAVIGVVLSADTRVRIEWQVIERPHRTR